MSNSQPLLHCLSRQLSTELSEDSEPAHKFQPVYQVPGSQPIQHMCIRAAMPNSFLTTACVIKNAFQAMHPAWEHRSDVAYPIQVGMH